MANISIKKDFKDGDKLLAQQLNNNFSVIEAGVNANDENLENVIQDAENRLKTELEAITADRGWDWNEGDRVTFFKGSEEEVANQEVKDGQLLYNETTGETYLDNEGKRIVTGSGNVVSIGNEQPTNTATKIWVDPEEIGEPLPHQLVVSPEEPASGEEVWFKNDEQKSVMVKNKEGAYEEFVKPQVKVGVEEPTTGEEVWIKSGGKQLFNKNKATLQYIVLKDNGTTTSAEIGAVSDYIIVEKLESIILSGPTIQLSNGGAFYDSSKTYISGFTLNEILSGVSVPSNAKYVRVNTSKAELDITQLEEGLVVTEFEPYVDKEIYVKNDNGVYEEFIPKIEQNIVNGVEYETGRIINGKKEYGKRINIGALPNATSKEVSTGLSNVSISRFDGVVFDGSYNTVLPLPYVASYLEGQIYFYTTNNGATFIIKAGDDKSGWTGMIELYYVKR